jgi:hypothetical protein
MPNSVIFVFGVEFLLIFLTLFLLLRPSGLFGSRVTKKKVFTAGGGLFFLFLTFIWSVVTGIVLSMNDLVFHL